MKKYFLLSVIILMAYFSAIQAQTYKMHVWLSSDSVVDFVTTDIDSITWSVSVESTSHNYVDLGLSVLWADCNVGANTPEGTGIYYAWGETTPKNTYYWDTYKYCNGSLSTLTKYCMDSYYGTVDNKFILEPGDDAATINWGDTWRIPTNEEFMELCDECTWKWDQLNGVNGYTVIGPNGNSIFLPAVGYHGIKAINSFSDFGYYWSSSLSYYYSYSYYDPSHASGIYFNTDFVRRLDGSRDSGLTIRPVCSRYR